MKKATFHSKLDEIEAARIEKQTKDLEERRAQDEEHSFTEVDFMYQQNQDKVAEMMAEMNVELDLFDAEFEASTEYVWEKSKRNLAQLQVKMPEISQDLNMDPGSSIGINGEFLQPAAYNLKAEAQKAVMDWGESMGGSTLPRLSKKS